MKKLFFTATLLCGFSGVQSAQQAQEDVIVERGVPLRDLEDPDHVYKYVCTSAEFIAAPSKEDAIICCLKDLQKRGYDINNVYIRTIKGANEQSWSFPTTLLNEFLDRPTQRPGVISFLLRHGADANGAELPNVYAAFRHYGRQGNDSRQAIERVIGLLLENGVDSTLDYHGSTPFFIACFEQSKEAVDLLARHTILNSDINVGYLEFKKEKCYKGDISFGRVKKRIDQNCFAGCWDTSIHDRELDEKVIKAEQFFNENYNLFRIAVSDDGTPPTDRNLLVLAKTAEEKTARARAIEWKDATAGWIR